MLDTSDSCSVLSMGLRRRAGDEMDAGDPPIGDIWPTIPKLEKLWQHLTRYHRPLAKGPGLRIRECVLCGRKSNDVDRLFGLKSFLFWAHMDKNDENTITGSLDKYCNDVLRRRWKGWSHSMMREEFQKNGKVKIHFFKLVDQSIEGYLNGTMRISHSMLDPPVASVTSSDIVREVVGLASYCLWSVDAFAERFPNIDAVKDMRLKYVTITAPTGESSEGWKMNDDGVRPLPFGVVPVARTFERQVDHSTTIDDGSDVLDANQLKDNFNNAVNRRISAGAKVTIQDCQAKQQAMDELKKAEENPQEDDDEETVGEGGGAAPTGGTGKKDIVMGRAEEIDPDAEFDAHFAPQSYADQGTINKRDRESPDNASAPSSKRGRGDTAAPKKVMDEALDSAAAKKTGKRKPSGSAGQHPAAPASKTLARGSRKKSETVAKEITV